MTDQPQTPPRVAPPYVAYPSFKNMVGGFKEHGLPGRIDRSVLGNFSGIVGSQLMTALKFLGLVDGQNHPQPGLKALVDASGTDQWSPALAKALREAYGPVFELDLTSASPSQFSERFSKTYPAEGSTLRKSITFFLSAAVDAKVPVSPYIMKNKKPRSAPTKRRSSNGKSAAVPGGIQAKPEPTTRERAPHEIKVRAKTPYQVLMDDIYDPAAMQAGSEEEKAVFTLARFLKTREAAR